MNSQSRQDFTSEQTSRYTGEHFGFVTDEIEKKLTKLFFIIYCFFFLFVFYLFSQNVYVSILFYFFICFILSFSLLYGSTREVFLILQTNLIWLNFFYLYL